MNEAAKERNDFIDPTTGEVVALDDADSVIEAYERIDSAYQEAKRLRTILAMHMFSMTREQDLKTRRLRGAQKQAKIELSPEYYDQKALREAWERYPQFRAELLKISSIGVKQREFNKAVGTTGQPAFEQFVKQIQRANLGRTGTPRITIEE